MSVQTVSFHKSTLPSETHITQLGESGPPYTVHGVALGSGDVTKGASGITKKWPADELEDAVDSLEGKNLVVDHKNNADGVVGEVTKCGFKEGTGIVYQAELYEEDYADKIENGLLEVSIRGYHDDVEDLEEDEDTDALIVKNITFENLSIVPNGAAPSNTLNMGEHEELSAAALQQFTASLIEEPEPAMWVQWGDNMHGITISLPEDGEIEVDIYEETDGEWQSTEETTMVDANELSEWDVEEDDVGAVEKDEDSEENTVAENAPLIKEGMEFFSDVNNSTIVVEDVSGTEVSVKNPEEGSGWTEEVSQIYTKLGEGEWEKAGGPDILGEGMKFFSTVNDGEVYISSTDGNRHTLSTVDGESQWMETTEIILRKLGSGEWEHAGHMDMSSEEMAADANYSQGDWVRWDTRNSTEIGKVTGSYTKGDDIPDIRGDRGLSPESDEILYTLRMYKDRDGTYHPIEGKPIGHYEESVRSADEPADVSESSVELGRSNAENYTDFNEGDWVQWYTESGERHGKVTSVDNESEEVTAQTWTQNSDGEWSEGEATVTKAFDDKIEGWGNFPREMGDFADGEDPRKEPADNEYAEENSSSELVSDAVEKGLKEKVEEHNEKHAEDDESKRVTYRMLKNVYNRGMGAYNDTHREGMTQQQWAYARVNAFLYLVRNGNPENSAYKQDNDLLPEGHPKYSESPDTEENMAGAGNIANLLRIQEGDMVEYQAKPEMFGRAVHIDEDEKIIMVEIMEESGGEMESTGFTVTAGYSDLIPMRSDRMEENSMTTADVITQDVFGEHEPMGSDDNDQTLKEIVEGVVTAELASDMDELDEVYSEWDDTVNMTASDLRQWSENPCSREASLEPVTVMKRNLGLLETNKSDWGTNEIDDAKRTISFINRMRGAKGEGDQKTGGSFDCPTNWAISLLNWAYNPFDEVPDAPDNDELDSVDVVELTRGESEEPLIRSLQDQIDMMRESPERFSRQEVDRAEDNLSTDEGETRIGEASDVASLAEFEMHEVSYSGTHEDSWSRPALEDFVSEMDIDDDISEYDDLTETAKEDVASSFIISASGFPADTYGDLGLPVVEPSGELSVNALAAVKGGHGASEVDGLSEDMEDDIIEYVNQLARDEFDRNWSVEENMQDKDYNEDEGDMDVPDDHKFESMSDAEDKAEDMGISGAHQMGDMYVPGDSHEDYMQAVEEMESTEEQTADDAMVAIPVKTDSKNIQITNMTNLEEELESLDSPVAVEAEELESLEEKADRLDSMSDNLEELRERTEVIDEVDKDCLEELRDSDDPMVVETDEYEELSDEAEQVKGVYAASLSEEYDAFDADELTDRYSIEELREKFEDSIGSVEEELTAGSSDAEPRSQDASEEELSEDTSEEELADEVQEKQEEIRNKILSR